MKIFFILCRKSKPLAPSPTLSENALITGLRQRDRAAMEYLYDHYSAALYGVIVRIVQTEEVAEELLQDVFLRIWDRFDAYDESKGKLFTWMINIARNQSIDKTRSKEINKEKKTSGLEKSVTRIDRENVFEQQTENIGITDVLKSLDEDQRFVMEHLYLKGYTQQEVADEFNIPIGTVKTRSRLAMQRLRNTLGIK